MNRVSEDKTNNALLLTVFYCWPVIMNLYTRVK